MSARDQAFFDAKEEKIGPAADFGSGSLDLPGSGGYAPEKGLAAKAVETPNDGFVRVTSDTS